MKRRHAAPGPRGAIAIAAQQLQMSEYELFQHARRCWYGEDTLTDVEREFGQYLMYADVPVWVRHFVRDQLVVSAPALIPGRKVYFGSAVSVIRSKAPLRLISRKTPAEYLAA